MREPWPAVRASSAARGHRWVCRRAPLHGAAVGRAGKLHRAGPPPTERALPCGEPVRGVTLRLMQPYTTGNGREMRFPLCRLSLSFCICLAQLTPYAAYQSPVSCTMQVWVIKLHYASLDRPYTCCQTPPLCHKFAGSILTPCHLQLAEQAGATSPCFASRQSSRAGKQH
jgi:hypothetical protein